MLHPTLLQPSAVCAGLLYAFGLNGHIASMNLYTIHELLSGDDRLTSVGILLGYAVSKRATSEMQASFISFGTLYNFV